MHFKKRIGVITTDFGFGPVSKAAYLIQEINRYSPSSIVIFWGDRNGKEYISNINATVEIRDMHDFDSQSDYDCIINVMNTDIVTKWKNEKPMFFVDSLAWMWDKPIDGIENVEKYFVQDYLVSDNIVSRLKDYTDVCLVPPITQKTNFTYQNEKKKTLVVNFSGVHNPFTSKEYFIKYCSKFTNIILKHADGNYDEIYFSSNSDIATELKNKYSQINYRSTLIFDFFPHDDFMKIISNAERVITNPGITTTLELLTNKIPFAYLLGSNYSQILMTSNYKKLKLLTAVMAVEDFGFDSDELSNIPEDQGVKKVTEIINEIFYKHEEKMEIIIADFLTKERGKLLETNMNITQINGQESVVKNIMNVI